MEPRAIDEVEKERMVARVQELGVKCDAGALTAEEIAEYRRLADLGTQRALERARQDRPVE